MERDYSYNTEIVLQMTVVSKLPFSSMIPASPSTCSVVLTATVRVRR